jgi:hypothetical protein
MNTATPQQVVVVVGRKAPTAVEFVLAVDWAHQFSDYNAGCLLRLHRQPIAACENGAQRFGWWSEHARLTHRIKARRYDLTTVTVEDLPY